MGGSGAGPDAVIGAGARRRVDRIIGQAIAAGRPICLDSSALIAYLTDEQPAAALVEAFLTQPDLAIVLSTVSLAEALTRRARAGDLRAMQETRRGLLALPRLSMIDFDPNHAHETALVRAETGRKLPDAAIVAEARLAGAAALLGNDRQWATRPLGIPSPPGRRSAGARVGRPGPGRARGPAGSVERRGAVVLSRRVAIDWRG